MLKPWQLWGHLKIDNVRRHVLRREHEVTLTPKQLELLSFLTPNSAKALPIRQILNGVWGPARAQDAHHLRVYIGQLRQKLEE